MSKLPQVLLNPTIRNDFRQIRYVSTLGHKVIKMRNAIIVHKEKRENIVIKVNSINKGRQLGKYSLMLNIWESPPTPNFCVELGIKLGQVSCMY